jgi:DNA-binding NtrC family response regulator
MKRGIILCVDDEKIVLDSVLSQLRAHFGTQFLYETAENTEEGWEVLDEKLQEGYQVVAVISDWLMPFERGDQFLIEIARKLPDCGLILLSGHVDEEAVERAKKHANLQYFIRKPWERDELIRAVETVIHNSSDSLA